MEEFKRVIDNINAYNDEKINLINKKEEVAKLYTSFFNYYKLQKDYFYKISNNNLDNWAKLFNFIKDLFKDDEEESKEEGNNTKPIKNKLLKLLYEQNNFINETYDYFLNPLKIKLPDIHMELKDIIIEKFSDKIQIQESRLNNLEKENNNLKQKLDHILRKALIRNLPNHFTKNSLNNSSGNNLNYNLNTSSNYNSHLNMNNYFNLHNCNFNNKSNIFTSKILKSEFNRVNEMDENSLISNENIQNLREENFMEKRLTYKINDYIHNISNVNNPEIINSNNHATTPCDNFENNLNELINIDSKISDSIYNTNYKNIPTCNSKNKSNFNLLKSNNTKHNESNSSKIPHYETNIISSKGIKEYIKSARGGSELEDLINIPNKKIIKEIESEISKNFNSNKPKINSLIPLERDKEKGILKDRKNNSLINNSSCSKIEKKTMLINKKRDLSRSNYGRNVAIIRENANNIIYSREDGKENKSKENIEKVVNINIVHNNKAANNLAPTNKNIHFHNKNNSVDISNNKDMCKVIK